MHGHIADVGAPAVCQLSEQGVQQVLGIHTHRLPATPTLLIVSKYHNSTSWPIDACGQKTQASSCHARIKEQPQPLRWHHLKEVPAGPTRQCCCQQHPIALRAIRHFMQGTHQPAGGRASACPLWLPTNSPAVTALVPENVTEHKLQIVLALPCRYNGLLQSLSLT